MLSIGNLHEEILERQNRKCQIFEDVLEKVISRIKYVNSISDDCYIVYALNNFIYGIPMFNINKCGNYLQQRLSDAGFYVQYNQKNLLYISWKSRPKQDKVIETHQPYIHKTSQNIHEQNIIGYNNSVTSYHTQYPNYKNSNKIDPNMLLLKNNNTQNNKQVAFQELDKQFLNSNQPITNNQNYNTNGNGNVNTNGNVNNNSNIKTFTINKYNHNNSVLNRNNNVLNKNIKSCYKESSSNLDDFLGILM